LALIGTGYALGDQWERVEEYVSVLQWIVIAVIVVGIARFAWVRVFPRFRN
jgi:membrane protein DedA with SNARE-associated domain